MHELRGINNPGAQKHPERQPPMTLIERVAAARRTSYSVHAHGWRSVWCTCQLHDKCQLEPTANSGHPQENTEIERRPTKSRLFAPTAAIGPNAKTMPQHRQTTQQLRRSGIPKTSAKCRCAEGLTTQKSTHIQSITPLWVHQTIEHIMPEHAAPRQDVVCIPTASAQIGSGRCTQKPRRNIARA